MSLVNDMLQNLDARQNVDQGLSAENNDAMAPSRYSVDDIKPYFFSLCIFVVIFLVVMLLKNTAYFDAGVPDDFSAENAIETKSVLPTLIKKTAVGADAHNEINDGQLINQVVVAAPLKNAQVIQNDEIDPALIVANEIHQKSSEIERYLEQAAMALNKDHLTTPIAKSAYLYYQKVLTLESENQQALNGIETISNRYVTLAAESVKRKDMTKARYWLNKADTIMPNNTAAVALMKVVDVTDKALPASSSNKKAEVDADVDALAVSDKPSKALRIPESTHGAAPATKALSVSSQSKHVVTTLISRDRVLSEKIRAAMAAGNYSQVETKLMDFLQEAQKHDFSAPESRRLLFAFYLAQGLREKAQALVTANTPEVLRTFFQAKLHLFDDDIIAAVTTLETQPKAMTEDEEYGAFTAGLYHKLQRFADAEVVYKKLLENFDYKARYWLGLGLSFDHQKKYALALKAYQRIAYAAGATDVMIDFSNKRIQELNT